ncbi:MAG TPA: DNA polymerase III subunit delta [Candidatus Limnocylindria bacterium]|nr:DNA polymerase III subunit delta [Candidatus Limnocylindria bacterium]
MPELPAEQLFQRLASGKPVPAIVLLGTDVYLRDLCRNKIIDVCVPEGARDWAVARVPGNAQGWQEALERAQTMPMLAPRQVIIVEDAESVESLGEKSREEIVEGLEKYLESPAPFTILLLEAAGLDGRLRFSKVLGEKALVVKLNIGDASAAALAAEMARELGVDIDREAAGLLVDILNGEPARMRVELEKLAAYVQGRGRIAVVDVEALVVAARKNTVWQLADMLATRKRDAALAFLDNLLREGEQPAGLVGALAWMYRKLIEARDFPAGTNGYQAARQLNMRPEAAEAAIRNARRLPRDELIAGLIALAETDSQLKSANPDPRALMEFLIARLTSAPAA